MEQEHPSLALGPGEDALRADHQGQGLRGRAVSVAALMEEKKKKRIIIKKGLASQNNSLTFFFFIFFFPVSGNSCFGPTAQGYCLGWGRILFYNQKIPDRNPETLPASH